MAKAAYPVDRAKGCVLGLMIGDALGAGVEGWPPSEIEALAKTLFRSDTIDGFFAAVPMGTFVSAGQPGQYREARGVADGQSFVPTGPPSNANVAAQCARRGMYTDDTNQSLALAASIIEQRGVDATAVGHSYARFFRHTPYRGYPPSSKRVMVAIEDGTSVDETGNDPLLRALMAVYLHLLQDMLAPLYLSLHSVRPVGSANATQPR